MTGSRGRIHGALGHPGNSRLPRCPGRRQDPRTGAHYAAGRRRRIPHRGSGTPLAGPPCQRPLPHSSDVLHRRSRLIAANPGRPQPGSWARRARRATNPACTQANSRQMNTRVRQSRCQHQAVGGQMVGEGGQLCRVPAALSRCLHGRLNDASITRSLTCGNSATSSVNRAYTRGCSTSRGGWTTAASSSAWSVTDWGSGRGQVLWSGPRLICIAGDFTRYAVHAVHEHRRSIDLVRYRYFGSDLLGLEIVVALYVRTGVVCQRLRESVHRSCP